jgi:condensin-2 complex subunit H2
MPLSSHNFCFLLCLLSENSKALTFEELCRLHIQAFARGADKYRSDTNLTKRVEEWQSKLAPILEEEESRPEFDIYVYGEHVIEAIQKTHDQINGKLDRKTGEVIVKFSSITRQREPHEVCRLFLASLSLVNSENVRFHVEEGQVMKPESLVIELLSKNIDRPMETYLAPSAAEHHPHELR